MSWYNNYINNIAQSNEDFYREYAQEWINGYFEDSTLVRKIKEEKYPFNNEYIELDAHIDSVAEITVNINKVIGDFISVIFKDCEHQNYRGQKYIYDNEIYLCYDKVNYLTKVAKSNLIRCNNEINWIDDDGNILKEDVFLGYELSSTNDNISKDGIVSNRRLLLYMQNNDKTKNIKVNQRFMFQHNQCFRVEEIDNYNRESNTDKDVTMIKMFLVFSPILPTDNKELNICDYNKVDYSISIDQKEINQQVGFIGKLNAIIKNEEEIIDIPLEWKSSDPNKVIIDNLGNYEIIGNIGDSVEIICSMVDNENIFDTMTINIVESYLPNKYIVVTPNDIDILYEKESIDFNCNVYIEGEKQSDIVECVAIGDSKSYKIEQLVNGYRLTNIHMSKTPLILTFKSIDCEDITITLSLLGLI